MLPAGSGFGLTAHPASEGKQVCNEELDPYEVLNKMLANVVTPMKSPDGKTPKKGSVK